MGGGREAHSAPCQEYEFAGTDVWMDGYCRVNVNRLHLGNSSESQTRGRIHQNTVYNQAWDARGEMLSPWGVQA